MVRAAGCVVTIGAVDIALLYPGKEHLERDIPDPGDAGPEQVRALVVELEARVRALWSSVRSGPPGAPIRNAPGPDHKRGPPGL